MSAEDIAMYLVTLIVGALAAYVAALLIGDT